jgi:hypothetical protein
MSVVESREAKNSFLENPDTGRGLLEPMAGDNEITIGVPGLPSIAGHMDLACDGVALEYNLSRSRT